MLYKVRYVPISCLPMFCARAGSTRSFLVFHVQDPGRIVPAAAGSIRLRLPRANPTAFRSKGSGAPCGEQQQQFSGLPSTATWTAVSVAAPNSAVLFVLQPTTTPHSLRTARPPSSVRLQCARSDSSWHAARVTAATDQSPEHYPHTHLSTPLHFKRRQALARSTILPDPERALPPHFSISSAALVTAG